MRRCEANQKAQAMTDALKRAREHEPQLYAVHGPTISADERGNYTVAHLGCSCGWNSDGKAEGKFSDHLHSIPDALAQEARLDGLTIALGIAQENSTEWENEVNRAHYDYNDSETANACLEQRQVAVNIALEIKERIAALEQRKGDK